MSKHNKKSATMTPPAPMAAPNPIAEAVTRELMEHGGVTLEEATRLRAYQLWERAGRPEGNGVSFWLEAEAEFRGGSGS
jgi:hypothetical protein